MFSGNPWGKKVRPIRVTNKHWRGKLFCASSIYSLPCEIDNRGFCKTSKEIFHLSGLLWEYSPLTYTSQVDSVFRAIWLVPLSRIILHYSPPSKTRWRPIMFTLRKNFFFNKRSSSARQHQKSNEIWQLSAQRYVFPLFFGDKCTQDLFKMFCLQMMNGRQADWVR